MSNEDTKQEVEDLLRRQRDEVAFLLEENRDLVEALRDALLEHDELMGDEIAAVIEGTVTRRTGRSSGRRHNPSKRSDSGISTSTSEATSV